MVNEERVLVGPHELRFRPPDRLYMTMRGIIDASHIEAQNMHLRAYAKRYGRPLRAICDMAQVQEIPAEARKVAVQMNHEYPYAGLAIVGASFAIRTIASTLVRAGQILAPHHFKFPIFFAKTPAEAEAWLAELPDLSKTG